MKSLASIINRWQAFFFAFVFFVVAPFAARAQEALKPEDAKAYSDLLKAAQDAADNNRFAEAIELWRKAWNIKQHWHLPCNIGEGFFLLQKPDKTATYLTRCVKLAPFPKSEEAIEHRKRVRAMLQIALDHVGVVVVLASPGARVSVDGEEQGRAPLSEEVFLMPGEHAFIAGLNGRSVSRALHVNKREQYSLDLVFAESKPEPVAPKPVPPKPIEMKPAPIAPRVPLALNSAPSSWSFRWMPSILLLGSSATFATAGALLRMKANALEQHAQDIADVRNAVVGPLNDMECATITSSFNEARNEQRQTFNASVFAFGAAGVLGIAGLVYPWLPIHGKSTSIAVSNSSVLIRGSF